MLFVLMLLLIIPVQAAVSGEVSFNLEEHAGVDNIKESNNDDHVGFSVVCVGIFFIQQNVRVIVRTLSLLIVTLTASILNSS
jgi:hypothetical protein